MVMLTRFLGNRCDKLQCTVQLSTFVSKFHQCQGFGGQARFHVSCSPTINLIADNLGTEGVMLPLILFTNGDGVLVAFKRQHRAIAGAKLSNNVVPTGFNLD